MQNEAFQPFISPAGAIASKRVAVTAAAASTLISDLGGEMLRLINIGANIVYVTFHSSSVVAATNAAMAIQPGQCEVIKRPAGSTFISAICDAALASTLNITAGEGL